MLFSIIIVNYNVKHFLEQCLFSVQKAIQTSGLEAEIIVIDNHSVDRSVDYLQPKFPSVKFITNDENLGFAKACNQGYKVARGKFLLFLNPDTILPEDFLIKCQEFLSSHPDAAALGVRMLDGRGQFLKESKRSFPSPSTSLFKLFGLSRIFPHSKIFAKYHLGYLDEHETHEVDVLAGAFMIVRAEVFAETGCFDETFFMYGEDIDLSYRIQKAGRLPGGKGYKNYYFPGVSLIHFKGESSKKRSVNYIRMFYNAMSIFVRKHYGGNKARIFNFLIHTAIWIRAAISAFSRFIQWIGLPLLDAGLILFSFWIMKNAWNQYVKTDVIYPNRLLWIVFPLFTIIYLIVAYYAGLYDKRYRRWKVFRSTLISTIVLLALYALLPEKYRFSRGIILFGAFLAFLLISFLRWLFVEWKLLEYEANYEKHPHTLIVGSPAEYEKVLGLLKEAGLHHRIMGRVAIHAQDSGGIGQWKKLDLLAASVPFDEVIFCEGTLSFNEIIQATEYAPRNIKIKFHASGSHSIIGSDSKDSIGQAFSKENGYKLADPYRSRVKRLIDILSSLLFLVSFPIHLFTQKKPFSFFRNCMRVLVAKRTWIGYSRPEQNLPPLRKAVLACNGVPLSTEQKISGENLQTLDQWYARDYEPANDLKLLWREYRRLGD